MKKSLFQAVAWAAVAVLACGSPVFAHGHGGGGGGGHGGGGHMGGGHMGGGGGAHYGGGGHISGSHFSGGHQMGGFSGGQHTGGMQHVSPSFNSGHHQTFGPSHSIPQGMHQGNMGGRTVTPSMNGSIHHGGQINGGQIQGGQFHNGQVHSGQIHHGQVNGGQINSGLNAGATHHHSQGGMPGNGQLGAGHMGSGQINGGHLQHQHGTALGSRPGIQQGSSSLNGVAGNGQHHFGGQQHTTAKMPGLGGVSNNGNHFATHGHHPNALQQTHQQWASQNHSVASRHANLNNQLGNFHHGHGQQPGGNGPGGMNGHHGNQGGPGHHGNGQGGSGNWNNGNGHHHQDWHNSHSRHYWPYYGWYGGFWGGGYGLGWGSVWNRYPGWGYYGLTPWGINQSAWGFGYYGYSNPYCYSNLGAVGYAVPYNYAQPLVITQSDPTVLSPATTTGDEPLPAGVTAEGKQAFDTALAAFKAGDWNAALTNVDNAIKLMPTDAVAHEFRSLALFTLGRYDESAEAIYAVLAVTPGWDWSTMIGLYGNPQDYTVQLRALESYLGTHLDSSAGRFLLAYHYMRCNHDEAAATQLKRVLELTPGNKVATDLLSVIEGPDAVKNLPGATAPILPPTPEVDVPDVKAEQVQGSWQATGSDGALFQMTLNADSSFKWSFTRDGKTEEVNGVWAVKDGTLALEQNAGGTMLADVTLQGEKGLSFRMTGAVANDPGLKFQRVENKESDPIPALPPAPPQ